MEITSTRRPPGLVMAVEKEPPPHWQAAAQKTLDLDHPPDKFWVGVPSKSVPSDEFDQAVGNMFLSATKMLSKELAGAGPKWLQQGVEIVWLGFKVAQLYEDWTDDGNRNIPALLVDSTTTALQTLALSSDVTGVGRQFFNNEDLQKDIGIALTSLSASAKGKNVAMALINKELHATEAGKVLGVVQPVIEAAVDSKDNGYRLLPASQTFGPGSA